MSSFQNTTNIVFGRSNMSKWMSVLVCGWTLLVLSTGLRTLVHPHAHWIAFVPVFILAIPLLLNAKCVRFFPIIFLAGLLIISVLIAGLNSVDPWYNLVQSAKLTTILVLGMIFFVSYSFYAREVFKVFVIAVYLNLILFVLGVTVAPGLAAEMAAGRWGTILAPPGELARLGLLVVVYAAYLLFTQRNLRERFKAIALVLASITLIYVENSRSVSLFLLTGVIYVILLLFWEHKHRALIRFAVLVGVGGLVLVIIPYTVANVVETQRLINSISVVAEHGFEGLRAVDPARFAMLETTFEAIEQRPFWGTGMGTTKAETIYGPMTIHMVYLQLWADLGIFGLVAFMWLILSWLFLLPKALGSIRDESNPTQRALYYNSIFLLLIFPINGLFHAFSTEWTEWMGFIIPYALLWEATHQKRGNNIR